MTNDILQHINVIAIYKLVFSNKSTHVLTSTILLMPIHEYGNWHPQNCMHEYIPLFISDNLLVDDNNRISTQVQAKNNYWHRQTCNLQYKCTY